MVSCMATNPPTTATKELQRSERINSNNLSQFNRRPLTKLLANIQAKYIFEAVLALPQMSPNSLFSPSLSLFSLFLSPPPSFSLSFSWYTGEKSFCKPSFQVRMDQKKYTNKAELKELKTTLHRIHRIVFKIRVMEKEQGRWTKLKFSSLVFLTSRKVSGILK